MANIKEIQVLDILKLNVNGLTQWEGEGAFDAGEALSAAGAVTEI